MNSLKINLCKKTGWKNDWKTKELYMYVLKTMKKPLIRILTNLMDILKSIGVAGK